MYVHCTYELVHKCILIKALSLNLFFFNFFFFLSYLHLHPYQTSLRQYQLARQL